MKEQNLSAQARFLLPLSVLVGVVLIWTALAHFHVYSNRAFPYPLEVLSGFREELASGRLLKDIIASLYRVAVGYGLATLLGIPLGLWLGLSIQARAALLPAVNFFRNLSPLAWVPFAILWFGIGDVPAIFLIFLAAIFPLTLATLAAVASIPSVYFRVARDYGITGPELISKVTLPAILPQIITALRVTAGLSWVVVVAAEMIAGRDGLGFAIWDARNGLRPELVMEGMIVIGVIGVGLDQLLFRLTKISSLRWGYER